jgi:hypothetical protein
MEPKEVVEVKLRMVDAEINAIKAEVLRINHLVEHRLPELTIKQDLLMELLNMMETPQGGLGALFGSDDDVSDEYLEVEDE